MSNIHIPRKTTISRRYLLRGLGAAAVSLPLLEIMTSTAYGQPSEKTSTKEKTKLAIISTDLGMRYEWFHPTKTGYDYEMPLMLSTLKKHRKDFTVFSNLDHSQTGGHSGMHSFLSGVKKSQCGDHKDGCISLDQRAAELCGYKTRYPNLVLWKKGMSLTRTGVELPALNNLKLAFDALFTDTRHTKTESETKEEKQRSSILDSIKIQSKNLEKKLGKADKEKIDEYFTSIRELEHEISSSAQWEKIPKPKSPVSEKNYPAEVAQSKNVIPYCQRWYEILRLALLTDSTRVVQMSFAPGALLSGLNGVTYSYHGTTHHGRREDKLSQLKIIETFILKNFSDFLTKMKSTKTLDGSSLFDSTMILFGSGMGDGSTHSLRNLPLVLAGGGIKHGQHIDSQGKQPLNNLYLSMLRKMGFDVDYFNTSTSTFKGMDI